MPPTKHNHAWAVKPSERCPACDLKRAGPYRLADGTWSDGVDRRDRLNSQGYGESNPRRLSVTRPSFIDEDWITRGRVWVVVRGLNSVEWFPAHSEAIAYADAQARTNQGENNE